MEVLQIVSNLLYIVYMCVCISVYIYVYILSHTLSSLYMVEIHFFSMYKETSFLGPLKIATVPYSHLQCPVSRHGPFCILPSVLLCASLALPKVITSIA